MRKYLYSIASYKPGKPVEELQRELGISRIIKLASNENPFPPSPLVRRRICEAASRINRYPESSVFYLRKRLAEEFSVDENEIIFGNGSDELIVFAVRSLVSPGDEVLTATPTFLIYKIASMVEGISIREIPMKDFRYDLKAIASAVSSNTKLIFIANPDNPTGSYVGRSEVEAFLASLPSDIFVFFDEAYFEFARELDDWPDTLSYVREKRNVIVSRTFSKYYGLAGLRIGYGFARRDIVEIMNKVREPFNVNSLAQVAALAALDSKPYYEKLFRIFKKEKMFLENALKKLRIEFLPSVTNFLLVKIGSNASELVDTMLKRGIIVRHMKAWGMPEFIRVTVGQPGENRRFIKELKRFLN